MSDEKRLTHELLKLLVQFAWADDEVAKEETDHILFIARAAGLEPAALAELESALDGLGKAPAPDLGLLRQHRDEALAAAKVLLMTDQHMDDSESELLEQLGELLA